MKISGKRQAYIGIGGGSECVQASIMGMLNEQECCAISIRQAKLGSSLGVKTEQTERHVENHGGEVGYAGSGVFRITPDTTGSGRFLENLPAQHMPSYLVIDYQDDRLAQQIELAINDFGDVDTVVAVDTGGDALYRTDLASQELIDTTPDQDLASLSALTTFDQWNMYSMVIAVGIDSPDYAADILAQANAQFIMLSSEQIRKTLALYQSFKLDGTCDKRYGKTPYAWQAALQGKRGRCLLPLPDHVINHPTNPWNPVVEITDEMAGIYLMDLKDHVKAISTPVADIKLSA